MKIQFTKYHANGNDFILLLKEDFPKKFCQPDIISRLCHRRSGIGADGLFIISPSKDCDFFLDYYNADGTWETLCANGSRCAASFMYNKGRVGRKMVFETGSGVHVSEIHPGDRVTMNLKIPCYKSEIISVEGIVGYFVDTGARHFIVESENLDDDYVLELGRKIRFASEFQPKGINVNFYRMQSDSIIEIRTYEKGVEQLMLSCSSGSAAVVYHLSKSHGLISPITTSSLGGSLMFTFDEDWRDAFCEGPAELLFSGEFEGNLF